MNQIEPTGDISVLDVGYSDKEYSSTDNFIEKNYPYPERLTALGVETPSTFSKAYPAVKVVRYDGNCFPFADKAFDVCWSNAVIEHVGGWERQLLFLSEIRRVSKRAFITTPNRLFPVEVHTRTPLLHYLPKKVFDKYLILVGKKWAAGDYMHLLSESELRKLISQAGIGKYKLFKNRLGGLTMDFVVICECE